MTFLARHLVRIAAMLVLLTACTSAAAATHRDDADTPDVAVVIGSSVAAGYRADGPAWPQLLADRIAAAGLPVSVVNESVGGTRFLIDNSVGPSVLHREQSQLLAVPNVRTLLVSDLINDIQQEPHQNDPTAIEAGIVAFVRLAHQQDVRVIVSTIPPYGGYERYDPTGDACRRAVNTWLLTTPEIDGVIDVDAALRDPTDPTRLRPDYDSGDHMHPTATGQQAIAAAVRLSDLTAS